MTKERTKESERPLKRHQKKENVNTTKSPVGAVQQCSDGGTTSFNTLIILEFEIQ